ncbi:hypothetical protein HNP84_010322 [Thermocatellispora tengchongensis]|uniref:Uncharacterized protein n=1 Tax=Thermocatellispora tengchongensis TaxID=1073253 RepID=A0A840PGL4_9ACTN|nr:hypothetical protein [Thermocatellispora tengchongensis]MBB5140554.1 hypothetical protein [Thermocatellispora tengchongensis]
MVAASAPRNAGPARVVLVLLADPCTFSAAESLQVAAETPLALELIGRITETDMAADWFEAQYSRISPASS